ncbi:CAP domain-containing protein [Halobacteria archaeon AArc-dxtr1]|nr:CAP domain-containing protein [Halobacteria archaeon AArc-dxtr1]
MDSHSPDRSPDDSTGARPQNDDTSPSDVIDWETPEYESEGTDTVARREASTSDTGTAGSIVRLLGTIGLVVVLVAGAITFGPAIVDELDRGPFSPGELPAPSGDPPETGDRDPDLVHPDDPNESSYETQVEVVSSATVEDFVHAEVNDRRADHGLESIDWDGTIASVSRAHSYDMSDRDYFAHTNPDGQEPHDRFQEVADYCQRYGENLALNHLDGPVEQPGNGGTVEYHTAEGIAEGLVDQWMNSTDHRAAILEENQTDSWDRGGVGVYITGSGEVYATHNFCIEADSFPITFTQ